MTTSSQNPDQLGTGRPDGNTPEPAPSTPSTASAASAGLPGRAVFATVASPYYGYLIALFVGVMLISNVTGTKGVLLFPDLSFELGFLSMDGLVTDGAFLLFPLAYVLGDVISEVYGFKAMRRVVLSGFAVLALAALSFSLTVQLPPADFYENQDVGVEQLADTLVFCTIAAPALGMALGSGDYWNYVVIGFVWKTLVEAVLLPVTYVVIAWIKKREPSYQAALSGSALSHSAV